MKSLCYCIFLLFYFSTVSGHVPYRYQAIGNWHYRPAAISAFKSSLTTRWKTEKIQSELPVVYKSFAVTRLRSKVDLIWETALECNNSGFEIQRKTGDGEWEKVAFVFSQATGGNSNGLLTYEYTDVNTGKALSQYRLKQLDLDKSITFSEERNVVGY